MKGENEICLSAQNWFDLKEPLLLPYPLLLVLPLLLSTINASMGNSFAPGISHSGGIQSDSLRISAEGAVLVDFRPSSVVCVMLERHVNEANSTPLIASEMSRDRIISRKCRICTRASRIL